MVFKLKKKEIPVPKPTEEVDEQDVEVEEEIEDENEENENLELKQSKVPKQEGQLTRQEVIDMVEGNLNRAMQLLQILRQG